MNRRATRRTGMSARNIERPRPALAETETRCGACDQVAHVTPNGHLWKHRDARGDVCLNRSGPGNAVTIEELPPVVMPRSASRRPGEPSRLDVGSNCIECGCWIPGERSLCGTCFATTRRP